MKKIPTTHLMSGYEHTSVRISDIPSGVSDQQLRTALSDYITNINSAVLRMSSTSISCGTSNYCNSLDRNIWVIFADETSKNSFIDNLSKANGGQSSSDRRTNDSIKRSSHQRSVLELDVDCSDPFGRTDFDDDGRGAAPTLPNQEDTAKQAAPGESRPANVIAPKVPQRKITVYVHATSPRYNISVLSAAISSQKRFSKDKNAAIMISRAFDTTASIPSGLRLDDLVESVFQEDAKDEDVLDVAVAYLRRVHLFSFYTGKGPATCEGDVLDGKHSAGTIFLRMKDADNFLMQKTKTNAAPELTNEENPTQDADNDETKEDEMKDNEAAENSDTNKDESTSDLLVKRLDESIAQALDDATSNINSSEVYVDEATDEQAAQIDIDEEKAKQKWLLDHSLLDADGRARCSFHFCRKLFKDQTFLHKHLLKKHPDHLAAEQAKCHDTYMMKNWEMDTHRPIPQIIIDCGHRFGLIPAVVTGAQEPIAYDPEPEMLKKDEELRAARLEEDRQRRAAAAAANAANNREYNYYEDGAEKNTTDDNAAPNNSRFGFVDVDDMKDEKVQLVFDVAVVLPSKSEANGDGPQKKKKKKKRKLL